ncbi:hypothetical protein [Periweissella fabalis]|uniref:Uncharacterized protein n=1 Tax=Periweissella fabalis TaxID=1070421 RepID=A0A7X6N1Y0_9LACO|nr:hypothetical protein [Periweissella fabalis]MCM0598291.1 hypothetical protein [Periweissella fabalis]NKZ23797.1 hypothetical protein [Periweissella fabalis]
MLKAISIYVSSVNEKTGKLYVAKRFSDVPIEITPEQIKPVVAALETIINLGDVQTINFVETHAHSLMA